MRFIVYPTIRDRERQANGRLVTGDAISQAPPSGQWVHTTGEPHKYYRVFGRPHPWHGEWLLSALEGEAQ